MKTVELLIDREGGLIVPAVCFEFEYAVLEVIHGESQVSVTGSGEVDADFTAAQAFAMLVNRYGEKEVNRVYKDSRDLARITGLTGGDDVGGAQAAQSQVKIHPKADKPAGKAK